MREKEIILMASICFSEMDQAGKIENERASSAVLHVFKRMCDRYEDANEWIERLEKLHSVYFEGAA